MPKCFFLDGPARTGKTFVYSTLLHAIRGKGDQAIAVASTRRAATLLSGGRIAHSFFKIPLTLNATSTCNLKPNSSEAKILLDAKVIVWDEAPMTHVHAFLAVYRLLKDLRWKNNFTRWRFSSSPSSHFKRFPIFNSFKLH
ncbi:hypothetical protein AVEN_188546-1 [Araneus ventricosus]|uniref:ATP-dependent DNA helicase n=1 Tax=Araneus ventricosus TaxID=182803 RepID=A0A4Y2SEE1_ARAVE|nr:hypothetical protein AVEN_188546-1 [Araneus ventricosus]